MEYYCENCGHVSKFGDFCFNCESPNMIPMNGQKPYHREKIKKQLNTKVNTK